MPTIKVTEFASVAIANNTVTQAPLLPEIESTSINTASVTELALNRDTTLVMLSADAAAVVSARGAISGSILGADIAVAPQTTFFAVRPGGLTLHFG